MVDKRIPISEANRDALKERKRGDDTYDDVIERLLDGGAVSECDFDADSIAETVAERLESECLHDDGGDVADRLRRLESAVKEATNAAQGAERAVEELQR